MDTLNVFFIIGFVAIVFALSLFGHKLLNTYKLDNAYINDQHLRTMLKAYGQLVEASPHRVVLQQNIAECYKYILQKLSETHDLSIRLPKENIIIDDHPFLNDLVLPYLTRKSKRDVVPIASTFVSLINYYNQGLPACYSVEEFLKAIVRLSPEELYGGDKDILDKIA